MLHALHKNERDKLKADRKISSELQNGYLIQGMQYNPPVNITRSVQRCEHAGKRILKKIPMFLHLLLCLVGKKDQDIQHGNSPDMCHTLVGFLSVHKQRIFYTCHNTNHTR